MVETVTVGSRIMANKYDQNKCDQNLSSRFLLNA